MTSFFIGFAFFEFGVLCGFFTAALMNAAHTERETTIRYEENRYGAGKEHSDSA